MPIRWEERQARKLIRDLYMTLLGRDVEPEVLRGLVAYFVAGKMSARTQFLQMIKSEEFFDKRLRDRTPEEVVTMLYQTILERNVESPTVLKGAVDFINGVGWRTQVDVMINSQEYIGKFGDDKVPIRDVIPTR
jgi:hypothetical protein